MTLSPYELLRTSRPQPQSAAITPYDLYSRIQQEPAVPVHVPVQASAALAQAQPQPAVPPSAARKTHYISDIHTKHASAVRHAAFTHEPLK